MTTKEPLNIQAFNCVVSHVLAELYAAFPNEIDLECVRIAHDASKHLTEDDAPLRDKIYEVSEDTVKFLIEEKFIRHNSVNNDMSFRGFPSVRLTKNGFTVLGSLPESLSSEGTLGAQLTDAVSKGATESMSGLVSKVLTGAVQLGVSALSG